MIERDCVTDPGQLHFLLRRLRCFFVVSKLLFE